MSIPSTPSLSTQFTEPSAQRALTAHFISGMELRSTDSKATPQAMARSRQQLSTELETSLLTQSATIGAKAIYITLRNTQTRLCYTGLLETNVSHGHQSRRGRLLELEARDKMGGVKGVTRFDRGLKFVRVWVHRAWSGHMSLNGGVAVVHFTVKYQR